MSAALTLPTAAGLGFHTSAFMPNVKGVVPAISLPQLPVRAAAPSWPPPSPPSFVARAKEPKKTTAAPQTCLGSHPRASRARPPALRLPQTQTPAPSTSLLSTSHLVSAALRFGLRQAHVDDVPSRSRRPRRSGCCATGGRRRSATRRTCGGRSRAPARASSPPPAPATSPPSAASASPCAPRACGRPSTRQPCGSSRCTTCSRCGWWCRPRTRRTASRRSRRFGACTPPSSPTASRTTSPRPSRNGYRALHEAFFCPDGHEMEIQLRTSEMHRDAEFGCAAHRKYKGPAAALGAAIVSGLAHPNRPLPPLPALSRHGASAHTRPRRSPPCALRACFATPVTHTASMYSRMRETKDTRARSRAADRSLRHLEAHARLLPCHFPLCRSFDIVCAAESNRAGR